LDASGLSAILRQERADLPMRVSTTLSTLGASRETIEVLNDKLALRHHQQSCSVTRRSPARVVVSAYPYGLTRWIGTEGLSAADSYSVIPASGEVRPHDSVLVVVLLVPWARCT